MINKNFPFIEIAAVATVITVITGCNSIQEHNKESALQDFVGTWNFYKSKEGSDLFLTGVQIELINGQLVVGLPEKGFEMRTTPVSKRKLEGTYGVIPFLRTSLKTATQVPITLEIAENKQELMLVMMMSQVDKKSSDQSFIAKRTTEPLQNRISKAKQAEAKQNLGSLNRAQQSYFLENSRFTSNLADLEIGMKSETENYIYSLDLIGQTGLHAIAIAKEYGVKSYTSGVFSLKVEGTNEITTIGIVCESEQLLSIPMLPPKLIGNQPQCPPGFRDLSKKG